MITIGTEYRTDKGRRAIVLELRPNGYALVQTFRTKVRWSFILESTSNVEACLATMARRATRKARSND